MQADVDAPRAKPKVVVPFISISWHGGTRILVQVANFLSAKGYDVCFLVSRNRCRTPFSIAPGVRIRDVGVYTGVKPVDYLVFLCCFPFLIGANSVVIANFFVTYFPIRCVWFFRRIPYLYFVQDIESKYPKPLGCLLNAVCRLTYRDQRIVAANAHLRDRLLAEFGTSSRCVSVGPDKVFYEMPVTAQKQYDVVYFLRGEAWKGLDRFLRFLKLSAGRLTCLCVSQNERLGEAIVGTGAVFFKPPDDQALVRCIDSARVLLLTSYHEGFALPPLEGMARGLPTVLFRCGGPELYVVDGQNGIFVQDEAEAALAIESLVRDPRRYARMSGAAMRTAEEYKMEKSLSLLAGYIESCSKW